MKHKDRIREEIWKRLEEAKVGSFPKPLKGRIPNFVGAEKVAEKLQELKAFRQASVVKINPDAPQRSVRFLSLMMGKTVIMPTPRLREGFIVLEPREIPLSRIKYASTIRGAFTYGRLISPENLPHIDLVVTGSVAVDICGRRLGKGEGYSEIEWGILSEFGKVNSETPILTTVHDLQIVREIPSDPWDFAVDIIVTPTRILRNTCERRKPKGIMWEFLSMEKLREIPLLQELKKRYIGNE